MCRIPIIFCNFEKVIEKNWFDDAFLWEYHVQLAFHLNQVFSADKSALCFFLDDDFIMMRSPETGDQERRGVSPKQNRLIIWKI